MHRGMTSKNASHLFAMETVTYSTAAKYQNSRLGNVLVQAECRGADISRMLVPSRHHPVSGLVLDQHMCQRHFVSPEKLHRHSRAYDFDPAA